MNEEILISLYRKRGLDEQAQKAAVFAIKRLEETLSKEGNSLEEASVDRIRIWYEQRITQEVVDFVRESHTKR